MLWATHLVDEVLPDDALVILHKGQVLAAADARDIAGSDSLESVFVKMTETENEEPA